MELRFIGPPGASSLPSSVALRLLLEALPLQFFANRLRLTRLLKRPCFLPGICGASCLGSALSYPLAPAPRPKQAEPECSPSPPQFFRPFPPAQYSSEN